MKQNKTTSRRNFIGAMGTGATLAFSAMASPLAAAIPDELKSIHEAEAWFNKVKGKHRIVYDATEPHDAFPIIWSWVFYKTNNQTGTPDNELTSVVVLRHGAIPFAMEDRLWEKYKFGERFKVNDPLTSAPAIRNPYWIPDAKMWIDFGIEGIKKQQERGVMFCVCDMAITVNSMMTAQAMNANPEEVKKEWIGGLLPGVQVVPSGVWAVNRAQEKGCSYCYAGG